MWIYSHYAAYLVLHQFFCISLQIGIQVKVELAAGYFLGIQYPTLVGVTRAIEFIPFQIVYATLTTKRLFILQFQPAEPGIVALAVRYVALFFQHLRRHFAYIAQHYPRACIFILPYITLYQLKTDEHICILLKFCCLRLAQLFHKGTLAHIYIAGKYPVQYLFVGGLINVKRGAKLGGIQRLGHIARGYHQVIDNGIGKHGLPLTIVNDTTRRIYYFFVNSYIVSHHLVLHLEILKKEKPQQYDRRNAYKYKTNGVLTRFCRR